MPGNKKKRPVNLNLLRIRLPVGGVVSIFHRVTGVLLVLLLPVSLYLLERSLADADGFGRIVVLLQPWPARVLLVVTLLVLAHHFFAGLRHLLLDLDIGISREGGRRGAWLVLVADAATAATLAGGLFL